MENNENIAESTEYLLESPELTEVITNLGEINELLSEENNEEVTTEDLVENEELETITINTVEYLDEIVMPKVDMYCMSILITLGIIAGILSAGYLFKKV